MKLGFLRSGSPDCPLIRLYDFDTTQILALQQALLQLVQVVDAVVVLHNQPGVEPVDGCQLTLRQTEHDRGVDELAENSFEWTLTKGGWLDVATLIQPFRQLDSKGHQWLNRIGKIAVLLSRDGRW